MNIKLLIVKFIRHPMVIPKSIWLNFRFIPFPKTLKFPIISSWKTTIKLSRRAKLTIENKVFLGYFTTRVGEIGQISYDRTILQLAHGSHLILNDDVKLGPGTRLILGANSTVSIGENTFISSNSKIICYDKITIGKDCAISWNVQIMDTDFHGFIDKDGKKSVVTKDIVIGDNVWIGSNVLILKGVKIGNGAVIAAGSVVTKSVLPGTLVGGNPAKVIRENIEWYM